MRRNLVIFLCYLLANITTCLEGQCKPQIITSPFMGRYCPTKGIITRHLRWHQCKLYCLHSSICQAVNYNFTSNYCIVFTETCPLAINHPHMAFSLLTGIRPEQCIDWIPKQKGIIQGHRSVTGENIRVVARMQKGGTDYVGYLITTRGLCLSRYGGGKIYERYRCQYLHIREGCTTFYVDYKPGSPLPPNALIAGYTVEGLPVYIGGPSHGYYIPGSSSLVTFKRHVRQNVKLLVSL